LFIERSDTTRDDEQNGWIVPVLANAPDYTNEVWVNTLEFGF
jgi:hypothetical protein